MQQKQKISIIGLGHVGLPMALILSNLKKGGEYLYDVNVIENNDKKGIEIKKSIENKNFVFNTNDKKFNKLFYKTIGSNKLEIRTDLENLKTANIIIVSINFEIKKNTKNFNSLKKLLREIGNKIQKKTLILFETTVPPGTCERILLPELKKALNGRKISLNQIYFSYSFERVMPGKNYLNSITSNYRCYSGQNNLSKLKCKKFLNSFINTKKFPLFELDTITECEAAKILENSYRAINIAFIDEWTKYSNLMKINLNSIIESIKLRPTHSNIMRPGLGVGGYCLTKDPLFAGASGKFFLGGKTSFPIIEKSMSINKQMPLFALKFIKQNFNITNKTKILILGMSYKDDVGDIRYSPSVDLLKYLLNFNKNIKIHDPFYKSNLLNCEYIDIKNNIKKFDLILFCTAHKQYRNLDSKIFSKKTVIIDLNNVLNENQNKSFKKKLKIFNLGNNA